MSAKSPADSTWPLRWDLLQRYRLIEIIALWEGRLTTNHLCDTFGIGRQQASKDLNDYLATIGAGNLIYDKSLKGYCPTLSFTPQVTSGYADEYLYLLSRNRELNETFEQLPLQIANTEVIQIPVRSIDPQIIRTLVMAARNCKRIEVDYVSLQNPSREGRIIAPHTLVHSGTRWHVRAFCEKNQDFRDFVLSRFRSTPTIEGDATATLDQDSHWNRMINIKIIADQRLSKEQRRIIEQDYGMKRGVLKISTRAALSQYVLQGLKIDPNVVHSKAEVQQIIIGNLEEVRPWLFS
jgi:predicted DNA-binding transcriptional regulator YafY